MEKALDASPSGQRPQPITEACALDQKLGRRQRTDQPTGHPTGQPTKEPIPDPNAVEMQWGFQLRISGILQWDFSGKTVKAECPLPKASFRLLGFI